MENQLNPSEQIFSVIDFIVKKNTEFMDELRHLQKLKELGVSPDEENIKIRMAAMQAQMEFSAGIMNILSASYGGVQIILPQNFNLLNPENPTDEKE